MTVIIGTRQNVLIREVKSTRMKCVRLVARVVNIDRFVLNVSWKTSDEEKNFWDRTIWKWTENNWSDLNQSVDQKCVFFEDANELFNSTKFCWISWPSTQIIVSVLGLITVALFYPLKSSKLPFGALKTIMKWILKKTGLDSYGSE